MQTYLLKHEYKTVTAVGFCEDKYPFVVFDLRLGSNDELDRIEYIANKMGYTRVAPEKLPLHCPDGLETYLNSSKYAVIVIWEKV